jgi:predicted Rdx family selenoprotein
LAAELKEAFGIEATITQGHSGVYDVTVDGELVFSKYAEGRHADPGEIVTALQSRGLDAT